MPQLHPCERKPDSSINTQKEGRSHSFYFLLCTFVLKESYSWLVLDSPSPSWVTTEAESQTSSHLAVQMAKTKSLGTFCPKPNGQETEFPQPSLPAHFSPYCLLLPSSVVGDFSNEIHKIARWLAVAPTLYLWLSNINRFISVIIPISLPSQRGKINRKPMGLSLNQLLWSVAKFSCIFVI